MSRSCSEFQEQLIDIFYDEMDLNHELKLHIDNCNECRQYFEELQGMKSELEKVDINSPIEYMKITEAFEKSEEILERRNNIKSFILFIVISSLILATLAIFAIKGYTLQILYSQVAFYFIMPILLPIIIKVRSVKEEYNE